jgi:tRNA threonylcarbamoyladenosine biosynthesis protein TsaB
MILALNTSDKVIEIYLLNEPTATKTVFAAKEKKWQAGRELGRTLMSEIEQLLQGQPLQEIVVFTGPGSFTGLRIGITTMNAIAYAEDVPIVGMDGEKWLENGVKRLQNGKNDKIVTPNYGAEPNISKPRSS